MTSAPRKILTVLLCALLASNCASVQSNHRTPPPGPFGTIKPGDRVVLQMREGHVEKVTVARIDGDTLIAKSGRVYARDEIVEIRRARRRSWTTTILLITGTLGGTALILNALGRRMTK